MQFIPSGGNPTPHSSLLLDDIWDDSSRVDDVINCNMSWKTEHGSKEYEEDDEEEEERRYLRIYLGGEKIFIPKKIRVSRNVIR